MGIWAWLTGKRAPAQANASMARAHDQKPVEIAGGFFASPSINYYGLCKHSPSKA